MNYKDFENFERVASAAREAYKEMEEMWYSYKELYKNGNSSDESFVDRVIIDAAEFAEIHGNKIEETFFGRKFKCDVFGDYIRGNDDYYFMYEGTKFYYNNLLELYNQLNEIVE